MIIPQTHKLPDDIPQEALPDQDFIEQINRIEKSKPKQLPNPELPEEFVETVVQTPKGPITAKLPKSAVEKKGQIIEYDNKPPVVVQKPRPLKLTYQWEGDCEEHKSPVSTFEVAGEFTAIVAYCLMGNHQVKSQRVIPVSEQIFHKKKGEK